MRKIAIFIALVFLVVFGATPALAAGIPKLPHAFFGSVLVNNAAASDGTQISATIDIGEIISTQNPVTTVGGSYGSGNPYLLVQGYDIPDGATITFRVTNANGTATAGTASFVAGGGPTRHDISVSIAVPPPPAGGGGGPVLTTVVTNLFGTAGTFTIDSNGIVQQTITATSADGKLTITIPAGTKALDKNGNPLSSLTAVVNTSPPPPPAGTNIIGLAYSFGPDGATFNPPLTMTWSYDPSTLPTGVAEEDLVIAYYDVSTGAWVNLPGVVDTANNKITASVAHFTTFAIIGTVKLPPPPLVPAPAAFSLSSLIVQPAQVQPRQAVTITVTVANTGGTQGSYTVVLKLNGVKEAEKSVTIAAGSSDIVTFSVSKEEAGSYSVTIDSLSASFTVVAPPAPPTPPAPPVVPEVLAETNWPLVGVIIAAVIVVILLVYFLFFRRRAA